METTQLLIKWYNKNKRELPWRNTNNAYFIWLSEIILQQTRVDQGLPYYLKYTAAYPTIQHLANANKDEVLKLWQGLGYYNRAVNMLNTAKLIVAQHKGIFPNSYDELIQLKGIGPYTAAAVASFAYNKPHAVVDGNVYRVLARLFNINEPINSTQGKKIFAQLAAQLLNLKQPATHNQAIMEFGAMVCKPKQPLCENCVLRLHCLGFKAKQVHQLPVKEKKRKPVVKHLNYLIINNTQNELYIKQRTGKGIWQGLYEFPVVETTEPQNADGISLQALIKLNMGLTVNVPQFIKTVKHQLTHQTLYASFWVVKSKKDSLLLKHHYFTVNQTKIHQYAVPVLLERFINTILPNLVAKKHER